MAGGEGDESERLRVELSVRIRLGELATDPDDSLFVRGVIEALFRLEEAARSEPTLPLFLRLPEETREPEVEGRSPETLRALRSAALPEIRAERSVVETPWLRLRLDGRICRSVVSEPEGTAFCSPGLRRAGLTSGCLACRVRSPRREASVRLRATLEMWRF
jgi:hypothetical protein